MLTLTLHTPNCHCFCLWFLLKCFYLAAVLVPVPCWHWLTNVSLDVSPWCARGKCHSLTDVREAENQRVIILDVQQGRPGLIQLILDQSKLLCPGLWKCDVTSSRAWNNRLLDNLVYSHHPDRAIHCLMTQLPASPSLVWHQEQVYQMLCLSPGQLSGKKSDFPLPLPDKPENGIKYKSRAM